VECGGAVGGFAQASRDGGGLAEEGESPFPVPLTCLHRGDAVQRGGPVPLVAPPHLDGEQLLVPRQGGPQVAVERQQVGQTAQGAGLRGGVAVALGVGEGSLAPGEGEVAVARSAHEPVMVGKVPA
jgi:hypothetical protein